MTPFAIKVVKINDVGKCKNHNYHRVKISAVVVDIFKLDPHGKFIEGKSESNPIEYADF